MARLRRSDLKGPGITRRRRGRSFSYTWSTGAPLTDLEIRQRIDALVIPPAWRDVWICPWPHGHIQAVGTDDAGRRQYRYHDDWRKRRDNEKFERIVEFGLALPALRKVVTADLHDSGLGKRRVLAAGVRLLDIGCFRVGGEEYAEEHGTFGVATLQKEHVTVRGDELLFRYSAKGSIMRTLTVHDPDVGEVIGALRRRRSGGDDLLAWKEKGKWVDVRATDINAYIKEAAGDQFSAKDFRTWSATVYAAVVLAGTDLTEAAKQTTSGQKRVVTAMVKQVSDLLGNTPAVCRSSYIDPRIIDRFASGETVGAALAGPGIAESHPEIRGALETAVIALLSDETA